ncbi:MAG TPA: sigma-70 family RNA polymerase sigma factor [Candidatus Acidoferrum sp.]|nr:sigma-70 family RNA polymerase sigma factor [Candidatus Acidoferrum sp.]
MSTATVALDGYTFEPACAASLCARKRSKLAEARLGNGEAFAEMMQPYSLGLYRRALRLTGNPADAEDARQEAMLKAFSRLNQFAGQQDDAKDDLHAWVSRITTNASIDLIRQRREGKYVSLEEPGASPEETFGTRLAACIDNPEERYARREMRGLLAASIARLAPELRQICLLRDVLQYSTTEVAARLGISAVAVRLRLFRAHRRLRDILRDRLTQKRRRPSFVSQERHAAKTRTAQSSGRLLAARPQAGYACGD